MNRPTALAGTLALAATWCFVLPGATAHAATCSASTTDPADNVLTISPAGPHLPGDTLTIAGDCFAPGQRLAIKIDRDDYGQLGADPDEEVAGAARGRIEVGVNGSFAGETLVIPRFNSVGGATQAGSHTLHLLDNDPVTSTTAPFDTTNDFTLTGSLVGDRSIRIQGSGWLDRSGSAGSQAIAQVEPVGAGSALSHATGHAPDPTRPFVWSVLAVAADGTIDQVIDLPDGTDAGELGTDGLAEGSFVVRVRSGYGLAGGASDITRSVAPTGHAFTITPVAPRGVSEPRLSGTARVGGTLAVSTGQWSPARSNVTVQWLRNGVAVPGASATTRKLAVADLGVRWAARVTASHGTVTTVRTTSAVRVGPGAATPGTVRIVGQPKVGRKVTARTARWGAGTKLTYQWLVQGKQVKGATGKTFRLRAKHVKKKVTVRVTGTRAGHVTVRATSTGVRVKR